MPPPSTSSSVQSNIVRSHLLEFLRGGSAHVDPSTALSGFPEQHYGAKPAGATHTPWQLLEHLRFTLRDLLEFSTNPSYSAPEWPDDYWPGTDTPPDKQAWKHSATSLLADLSAFEALVENSEIDLEAPIPWGQGQTLFREILLAIDHTSYHLGQLVLLRKQLGDWKG